jgi:hypothetical protein
MAQAKLGLGCWVDDMLYVYIYTYIHVYTTNASYISLVVSSKMPLRILLADHITGPRDFPAWREISAMHDIITGAICFVNPMIVILNIIAWLIYIIIGWPARQGIAVGTTHRLYTALSLTLSLSLSLSLSPSLSLSLSPSLSLPLTFPCALTV